jgi:long-chain fatty acid transport protein
MKLRSSLAVAALVAASVPGTVFATAGYLTIGSGAKAMGIAGTGTALPQDSLAAVINPAGMAFVGNRADLGVRLFNPKRSAELDPTVVGGSFTVSDDSRRDLFAFPNFGYNSDNGNWSWGISGYATGGMNTTYDRNIYDQTFAVLGAFQQGYGAALAGGATPQQAQAAGAAAAASVPPGTGTGLPDTGTLGIDFGQMVFAPTFAYKINPDNAVGISALVAVQRLAARGLGDFQCFTPTTQADPVNGSSCRTFGVPADPTTGVSTHLTNRGYDYSYGGGVRIGYTGNVTPWLTLGAAWTSKLYMSDFSAYKELLAEQGSFDTPSNFSVGLALHPTPQWDFAFDYARIFYSDVNSISNTGPVFNPTGGPVGIGAPAIPPGSGLLGASNGLGFGWQDINIYRLGILYKPSTKWTFRVGYEHNDSPIPDSQLLFNIVAPAVVKNHATVGLTLTLSPTSEVSMAYMHAFSATQSSNQTAFGVPGSIQMDQNSFDISYAWTF